MHTPINTLARSAVAVLAGLPASAQVVEVNDGETLTEADLRGIVHGAVVYAGFRYALRYQ